MARNDPLDMDLGEKGLGELGELDEFFSRNVNQSVEASRAATGTGGSGNQMDEFAREQSRKQVAVQSEIHDRLFGIHQERSMLAQETDEMRRAPVADSPEQWADNPSRFDWPGIDLPR